MPLTASAVVGAVGALSKVATGISQNAKAKKLEKRNVRPTFNIQDEYFQNRDVAASGAQHGLSEKAINYHTTEAQRGLSAGIGATLQAGGDVNNIMGLNDTFNRSIERIAMQDAEAQTEKIKTFMQMNNAVAGQKTQKWVIDKYEPYKDTARAVAQMRAAGQQNIQTGIGELGATGAAYATGTFNQDMLAQGNVAANNAVNAQFNDTPKVSYNPQVQEVDWTPQVKPPVQSGGYKPAWGG
jgi:hypothetical protein